MQDCTITTSFVAAVSGHPQWWEDHRRDHCAYCGVKTRAWMTSKDGPAPGNASSRDHILPKKLGGRLLVPACLECNRAKGSGSLEQFMDSERFRSVRTKHSKTRWPVEELWLAHAAATLQICFRAKDPGVAAPEIIAA